MIQNMDDWVPDQPEHTDLVVIGMQESTYKVRRQEDGEEEEEPESDVSFTSRGSHPPLSFSLSDS